MITETLRCFGAVTARPSTAISDSAQKVVFTTLYVDFKEPAVPVRVSDIKKLNSVRSVRPARGTRKTGTKLSPICSPKTRQNTLLRTFDW